VTSNAYLFDEIGHGPASETVPVKRGSEAGRDGLRSVGRRRRGENGSSLAAGHRGHTVTGTIPIVFSGGAVMRAAAARLPHALVSAAAS